MHVHRYIHTHIPVYMHAFMYLCIKSFSVLWVILIVFSHVNIHQKGIYKSICILSISIMSQVVKISNMENGDMLLPNCYHRKTFVKSLVWYY